MKAFDWNKPQRQPMAGLAVHFLHSFWEVIKRMWVLLLVYILGKPERINKYELYAFLILSLTLVNAVVKFIFFKFYLEEGNLIIKKGWLKKEAQTIPLDKIQSVNIEQGPLHQLLNIVKLSIDTAGSQKLEAVIGSLSKPMAESLRERLLAGINPQTEEYSSPGQETSVIRLGVKDLLKLSISANHLEAFFIILSFGYGIVSNINEIDRGILAGVDTRLPVNPVLSVLLLVSAALLLVIAVSTALIFLKYYDLRVYNTGKAFRVRAGLTNIKEKLVNFEKIVYVSWHANWIRRLMHLWLLEYHVAGGDHVKNIAKVHLAVTRDEFIPLLTQGFHPIPVTAGKTFIRIKPQYISRTTLLVGIIPALIFMASFWWSLGFYSLYALLLPAYVATVASLRQHKSRFWAMPSVLYIRRGLFGIEEILVPWKHIQSISLSQTIYQRSKDLASIRIYTAAGDIRLPYLSLEAAKEIINYGLYKTEWRTEVQSNE